MTIRVVDVFAGPGGLNEGFATFMADGVHPFGIALSIEKDAIACDTLRLRAALRAVQQGDVNLPRPYVEAVRSPLATRSLESDDRFSAALERAHQHVWEFTLDATSRHTSDERIRSAVAGDEPWVLVGGPPCQLYSLVGRARASHLDGFEDDVRHVLYKEYLHIIDQHQPDVFVMENVKGMLSATHRGGQIFELIREDVAALGYELRSFVMDREELQPSDFVIRSERYGIPQRRHRVILFGVKNGEGPRAPSLVLRQEPEVSVKAAIGHLPKLRSRLSPAAKDHAEVWEAHRAVGLNLSGFDPGRRRTPKSWGGSFVPSAATQDLDTPFHKFVGVHTEQLGGYIQHESRSHMASDVERYAYYSAELAGKGSQVRVNDLPRALLPNHRNVGRDDTPFSDRFRVQGLSGPSTTVVSHIAKDGHYFIHPDPVQARSLTVREAARLQSFPDDYYFCGNRTNQFHQVGNAVPPLLARQIAGVVHEFLT